MSSPFLSSFEAIYIMIFPDPFLMCSGLFSPIWSVKIRSDLFWSFSICSDSFWYDPIHSDPFRSVPIWSVSLSVPICFTLFQFFLIYSDLFRSVPIIFNYLWYVLICYNLTLHFALHCAVDFAKSAWCYSSLLTWHDDPFKISHPWNGISGAAVSDLRWSAKHKQASSQSINDFARIKSI